MNPSLRSIFCDEVFFPFSDARWHPSRVCSSSKNRSISIIYMQCCPNFTTSWQTGRIHSYPISLEIWDTLLKDYQLFRLTSSSSLQKISGKSTHPRSTQIWYIMFSIHASSFLPIKKCPLGSRTPFSDTPLGPKMEVPPIIQVMTIWVLKPMVTTRDPAWLVRNPPEILAYLYIYIYIYVYIYICIYIYVCIYICGYKTISNRTLQKSIKISPISCLYGSKII